MPRRTTTPADDGTQSNREDHAAAMEQAAQQEQTAGTQAVPADMEDCTSAATPMKIDVRITSTRNFYDDPTRATATVTLNDAFAIKGVRVVKGENGLFCSMPARKLKNGEFSEVCHPITTDFARQLNASVLGEYQVHLAQQMEESQQTPHIIEPEQDISESPSMDFEPQLGGDM